MDEPTRPIPEKLPSGRHGLTREAVERSQRDRLLEAMLRAVAENGYLATSVAEVISRAGVSRATFYEFFKDKEDCYIATFDAYFARHLERIASAGAQPGSWAERVRRGISALLGRLAADPGAARALIVEVNAAGPVARERYRASLHAFMLLLEEGRAHTGGRELPPNVDRIVVGGADALVFDEIAAGRTEGLPRLLPEILYSALVPYLGHEAAFAEVSAVKRIEGGLG
jgi:AcrR family transcriptional regulator